MDGRRWKIRFITLIKPQSCIPRRLTVNVKGGLCGGGGCEQRIPPRLCLDCMLWSVSSGPDQCPPLLLESFSFWRQKSQARLSGKPCWRPGSVNGSSGEFSQLLSVGLLQFLFTPLSLHGGSGSTGWRSSRDQDEESERMLPHIHTFRNVLPSSTFSGATMSE